MKTSILKKIFCIVGLVLVVSISRAFLTQTHAQSPTVTITQNIINITFSGSGFTPSNTVILNVDDSTSGNIPVSTPNLVATDGTFTLNILVSTFNPTDSYNYNVTDQTKTVTLIPNTPFSVTGSNTVNGATVTLGSPTTTKNTATINFTVSSNVLLSTPVTLGMKWGIGTNLSNIEPVAIYTGTPPWPGPYSSQSYSLTSGTLTPTTTYNYSIINYPDNGTVYASGTFSTANSDGTPFNGGNSGSAALSNCTKTSPSNYCLIQPLPNIGGTNIGNQINVSSQSGLATYITWIFNFAIGFGAVLAVVMIVIGGIQYMGTESVFSKGESKGRIKSAILGVLILLGSWIILNTINPNLLNIGTSQNLSATVSVDASQLWNTYKAQNPNASACQAILSTAQATIGSSTQNTPGTNGGTVACAYVVDTIIQQAMGSYVSGNCENPQTSTNVLAGQLQNAVTSGRFTLIASVPNIGNADPATLTADGALAQPGDIIISPTSNGNSGHVGICETTGCTTIISNSTSQTKVAENFHYTSSDPSSSWISTFSGLSLSIYRATGC